MKKHILFFTLICIVFAVRTADDTILTLQSNDGQHITIPTTIAKHSEYLATLIGDCPTNTTVLVTNFNAQELKALVDVLNTIHHAQSDQDAQDSLHNMINTESEHSLAAIHDFFDIDILRQVLAKHFFHAFGLEKTKNISEKVTAITKICNRLWINSTNDKIDATAREKSAAIYRAIETISLTDKENFLRSKGKEVGLFFTGVSVGEAAQYGLVNMNYIPADTINSIASSSDIVINTLSSNPLDHERHFDVRISYTDYLTSMEGLRCESPIDITKKLRTVWIFKTSIWYLPADGFQYAQDPEILLINYNKLASIDTNAFRGLDSLKYLNLSHNNLTFIPTELFAPLVNLEEISLSDNRIKHLYPGMFKESKKIKKLYALDTLIPQQEINALRTALPNTKIYASFSPLVASNYSLINS